MTDYNIFAIIVPCPYTTAQVFQYWNPTDYNLNRAVKVLSLTETQSHTYDYFAKNEFRELETSGCIVLYLNQLPKNAAKGWVFGKDQRTCDVCLGIGTGKLSLEHFRIQIDDQHRIWLHEQSSNGTVIKYGQHSSGSRRSESMFLHSSGRRSGDSWPKIKIMLDGMKLWIYFPNHNSKHPDYLANLQQYHAATLEALPSLHGLGLASKVPTVQATEVIPSGRLVPPFMFPMETLQLTDRSNVAKVFNTREGYICVQKEFHYRSMFGSKGQIPEQWVATIREQVGIMKRFTHPNIAPVLDFWESPNPTLVMPCYEHGDLQNFYEDRRRAPLEVAKVRNLMRQLLSAVAQIHASGAVHRDLKATNIAVDSCEDPFTVVILDFDLASANPNGVMQTYCGTPHYTAPEIITTNRVRNYGPKVDIWSLGIVFLEAIRPMFMNYLQRNVEYKRYILAVEDELKLLRMNKGFSKVEKDIIRGMLYVTPSRRLTAARCLELGCEAGLFRKSGLGEFIYEAGDALPVETAEPMLGQQLPTIVEDMHYDDAAEATAQVRSCYNIPSEATTHWENGDTTPRATGGSTPTAHKSSVLEAVGASVEDEEVSEYYPAPSGSRAPMHRLWSENSQYREPSQASVRVEDASSAPDEPSEVANVEDSDSSSIVVNADTTEEPVQKAVHSTPATIDADVAPICVPKKASEPTPVRRRPDPAEDPKLIAILNDLRAHRAKKTPNWKRSAPEDDAQHILETQVVPAKKRKYSPLYPGWYNSPWTPSGARKW